MGEDLYTFENIERFNKIFSSLSNSSGNRLKAYDLFAQGYERQEVAEELNLTKPSLSPYIQDWKRYGLIEVTGKSTRITSKGIKLHEWLTELEEDIAIDPIELLSGDVEPGSEEAELLRDYLQDEDS